jgi:hypothetical protein
LGHTPTHMGYTRLGHAPTNLAHMPNTPTRAPSAAHTPRPVAPTHTAARGSGAEEEGSMTPRTESSKVVALQALVRQVRFVRCWSCVNDWRGSGQHDPSDGEQQGGSAAGVDVPGMFWKMLVICKEANLTTELYARGQPCRC